MPEGNIVMINSHDANEPWTLLRDTQGSGNLAERFALGQGNFGIPDEVDDLFCCVSLAAHSDLLLPASECTNSPDFLDHAGPLPGGRVTSAMLSANKSKASTAEHGSRGKASGTQPN